MRASALEFYSEGYVLTADLYMPEDAAPGDLRPGILLCHGYTGVKDLYSPEIAARFAAEGYIVLTFDYKGWGTSAGPKGRLAPYSRVADAHAALTLLSLQPQVDSAKLALCGTSYGGSIACWLAAHSPLVRCVASVVGVGVGERWLRSVRSPEEWTSLLAQAEADRRTRTLTGRSSLVPREVVLKMDPASLALSAQDRAGKPAALDAVPLEYVDETLAFNPEWIVDRIAPRAALFITAELDGVVLPEESERMYERAGEPKKLVVLRGRGHYDIYRDPALRDVISETLNWFREHMP